MDGSSSLIIAFFILFIRSGLSQRHGSFGYQSPSGGGSTSYNSQGFGASFGDGQSYATHTGGNREGGNRRVSDASIWNSGSNFGSSKMEDNNRKISSTENVNNQWNSGSGWNTGGSGASAGGSFGSSSDSKDQGWNFGSQNEDRNPIVQAGKEENQRMPNENLRKPGGSSSDISFGFQSEDSKRAVGSEYGGFSFGFDSKTPQTGISSGGGNSNWGSGSVSLRPQGSSSSSGSTNWSSGNQNGDRKTDAFDGSGFYSSKQEENQRRPGTGYGSSSKKPQGGVTSNGNSNWNSGNQNGDQKPDAFGGSGFSLSKQEEKKRRPNSGSSSGSSQPQGGGSSSGSDFSWGFDSDSIRQHGSSSSTTTNWGSGMSSNSQRPQSGLSDWGFGSDSDLKESDVNFDSESKRPHGSSNSGTSNWGFGSNSGTSSTSHGSSISDDSEVGFSSDSARKRPHLGGLLNFGSHSDKNKPHGSNSGSNSNSNKPQTSSNNSESSQSSSKPPKGNGQKPGYNSGSQNQKPNGNGSDSNKTKTEEVDWSKLELQNQQSTLTFDLSELWRPNDKKDFAWKSIWTRTRFRRDDGAADNYEIPCQCMEYSACAPEKRIDVLKFLRHEDKNLRVSVMECATKKNICCITSKRQDSGDTHPSCGKRVTKLAEHDISNDGSANYGDYPWVLRLVAVVDDGEETLCSASLIHNSIALTTASCALLLTGKNVRVLSGEWNVFGGNDQSKREETTIGKVYLHPEFDVVNYRKDLALLFLDTPLHYNRGANTICLPTHHDAWDASKCVVVGWKNKIGSALKSAVLKEVDLDIVAQGKCRHRDGLKNGLSDLEDPGYLCAHTRKDDPYMGDVGASLFCPLHKTGGVIQVGFVSNSPPGKRDRKTSTFTDVLDSLDWVYRMEGIYTFVTGEDAAD